jgi:hypothetical protein
MFDPAGLSGLANLTGGLLASGAGSYTRERIQSELTLVGAQLSIRTDWDATWMTAEGPAGSLVTILDVMSLMVTAPRFDPADVETLRKLAMQEVGGELANQALVADRAMARSLFGAHTYGRSIWGDPKSLAAITAVDVRQHYEKFYAANGASLAIVSPQPVAEVAQLARARFGRWPKRTLVPATFLPASPAHSTRYLIVPWPGDTVEVRAGQIVPGRNDRRVAEISRLGGRLLAELFDRVPPAAVPGLAYEARVLDSPFTVSAQVTVEALASTVTAIVDAFAASQSPGGQTVPIAVPSAETGPVGIARSLAASEFYRAQKLVADVGPAPSGDTVELARTLLKPAALTFVLVGDADKIRAALGERAPLEVVSAE